MVNHLLFFGMLTKLFTNTVKKKTEINRKAFIYHVILYISFNETLGTKKGTHYSCNYLR